MAVSGIMLMGFVAYHMVGNLHIYEGAAEMNEYGEFLRELLVPILPRTVFLWIARIGLIVAFFFHIHSAYGLTRINQKSRAGAYVQPRDYKAANVASRTHALAPASSWCLYLVFHLADLTWGRFNPDFVRGDVYRNVEASLSSPPVAIIYIVANMALAHPPVPRVVVDVPEPRASTTPSQQLAAQLRRRIRPDRDGRQPQLPARGPDRCGRDRRLHQGWRRDRDLSDRRRSSGMMRADAGPTRHEGAGQERPAIRRGQAPAPTESGSGATASTKPGNAQQGVPE